MQSVDKQTVLAESDVSASAGPACALDSISIVVPLYNERDGLAQLCERLLEFHSSLDERMYCEFLLIDDGSSDDTADMLCEFLVDRDNCRIIKHSKNQGIAAAIHTGLLHAKNDCVVSIDSDGSYDLDLVTEMLPRFTLDIDVIVASPYHPQGRVENVSAWRIALSKCASRMYRAVIRQKLHCYTSCFRVYRRTRCVGLDTRDTGFVGIAEFLWEADTAGCKIIEHPAILQPRTIGKSKMKLVRVMLGHLQLMGRIAVSRLLWWTRTSPAIAPSRSETS
jgi:dolichol-phosphate mannosyltransferase